MPDWVTYRSKWDWQGFLDRAMDRLIDENIGKLIIDIRGNEGGTECGWHLLERLVDRPIELPVFARRTRYRAVPADLNAVLDTWNNEFRDWGAAVRGPDTRGFYDLSRPGTDERVIKPRGRRYAGAIVLLADSTCSSATHQFAGAVKAARVAQFVGEPTGGNLRGINGDGYFFLRLPGTGIEVDVPLVGHFPAGTVPNAGVTPDHLVAVARKDIASGYDRQMAKAIAILTKQ
jgi:C-terminal processing protease CtpA/Prc